MTGTLDRSDEVIRLPLREQVLGILQSAIVSGEIEPGERIRDINLAERLGVSRTPVREALQQLEAQGLVVTRPGAMTRVTPLDSDEARDLFPVVAALHGLAARIGVPRLLREDIERMHEHNQRVLDATESGDVIGAMEADSRFHDVLVEAADNQIVNSLLDWLTPRVRRYEYASFDMDVGHRSVHDHDDIVHACSAGKAAEVAALVETNWLTLGERIVRGFAEQERPTPPDDD